VDSDQPPHRCCPPADTRGTLRGEPGGFVMHTPVSRWLLAAAGITAIGSLTLLSGCLVSGHSNTTMSGAYVGPTTFSRVEPGVTTEEWALAAFGKPTERTTLSDGTDLLKWTSSRTKRGSGSVFLRYGGSNSIETHGAAVVQVRDGVPVGRIVADGVRIERIGN
jgi:hypothetical protein